MSSDDEKITEDSSSDDEKLPSLDSYSLPVQRRMGALRKLHLDFLQHQAEFVKEEAELRKKFDALFLEIFNKRDQIIKGDYEPTEEEMSTPEAVGTTKEKCEATSESAVAGVPDFWKKCLSNSKSLSQFIHVYDLPLLSYVTSITKREESLDEEGYAQLKETIDEDLLPEREELFKLTLQLHLSPNPFVENTELTKILIISHSAGGGIDIHSEPFPEDDEDEEEEEDDEDDDGKKHKKGKKELESKKEGSANRTIKWKSGKEIGIEEFSYTETKKEKGKKKKGKKATTKVTKDIKLELPSFFDLFLSRQEFLDKFNKFEEINEAFEDDKIQEAFGEKLKKEYDLKDEDVSKEFTKIGHYLQFGPSDADHELSEAVTFITDTIIPNAFYFFTGDTEKLEDVDDDDEEEEEDFDDDDDDDDDDDNDDDDDDD